MTELQAVIAPLQFYTDGVDEKKLTEIVEELKLATNDRKAEKIAAYILTAADDPKNPNKNLTAAELQTFVDALRPLQASAAKAVGDFDRFATDKGGQSLADADIPIAMLFGQVMEIVVLLILPLPLCLLLNVVQPPTTAMMLARTWDRWTANKEPAYPRRRVVSRDSVSPALRRAVLASEDDRFYLHHGFDFEEIEKAIERRNRGRPMRGASTISQQVVKNVFLWEGRSWVRKGIEAYITVWLELVVPKDRILDLYVNLAEWGDGIFGIEAAAQHHFRKSARRLSREESARLAAVLPSPVRWSPRGSVASARAASILPRMVYPAPRTP